MIIQKQGFSTKIITRDQAERLVSEGKLAKLAEDKAAFTSGEIGKIFDYLDKRVNDLSAEIIGLNPFSLSSKFILTIGFYTTKVQDRQEQYLKLEFPIKTEAYAESWAA